MTKKRITNRADIFFAAVALFAGFLLASFVNTASAFHSEGLPHHAYVLGMDPSTKTLDVRLYESAVSSPERVKGEITVNADPGTKVTMCNKSKNFDDIRVGDTLTLMYHDMNGKHYADNITIWSSPERKC